MKSLRSRFERFCFRNRNKGIPHLMAWVVLLNVVVYIVNIMDPSQILYLALRFDRAAILRGEVWRLFSFAFLELSGEGLIWAAIAALFYFQLGEAVENSWGALRFNLYYLTGILCLDVAGMVWGIWVSPATLHMTLFLAYATMFPDTQFLIFFIIPVKARWLGILDLAMYLVQLLTISAFPYNLLPLFALANYFLYFGKDFLNIFPVSWRVNASRLGRRSKSRGAKTIPFPTAGSYQATTTRPEAPYTHRCTVCGRTNLTDPNLEFRYCSKCKGYYCYCMDHINNHVHIQ